MADNFEWQTEEDDEWLDVEQAVAEKTAVSHLRIWPFLLLVLVGIFVSGSVVYRRVQQQVSTATADVEVDILTSHTLIQTAVSNQDDELFHSQLSSRDRGWMDTQDELLAEGLLYERPFYLLPFQLSDTPITESITVTVSPDLRSAELQFPVVYQVGLDEENAEDVVLWQTAVYRRGSNRWLLSPPLREFWGDWRTFDGKWIVIHYPQRDEQIVAQLAADLDDLIDTLCDTFDDINCRASLEIEVRLDTAPSSLMGLDLLKQTLEAGTRLELPTPTLVGLPQDEAAYALIYRGYGVQVATAVIATQTAYDCCERGHFFRTILEYQLADLSLVQWPPQAIDTIEML
ncbi:MAG: hypothetical protein GY943_28255, partial [Chloroflexi bacterium]|nr:hypothetical protein [Chloroflexota bacterium]